MVTARAIGAGCNIIVLASLFLAGCAKPPQANPEQPPAPQQVAASVQSEKTQTMPALTAPTLEEVRRNVDVVFKEAVVIDTNHDPNFLIGDFNGDESQDVAVVLRPAAGRLAELNQEFPNWIAREPLKELLMAKSAALDPRSARSSPNPAAGQTVRFEQSDVLLAIIHGQGSQGWRDPQATQTHLLRGVVGSNLRTQTSKAALRVYRTSKPLPPIFGDVIQEVLIGQTGFLYFAGALYEWYDPKNYKSESSSMPAHSTMSKTR